MRKLAKRTPEEIAAGPQPWTRRRPPGFMRSPAIAGLKNPPRCAVCGIPAEKIYEEHDARGVVTWWVECHGKREQVAISAKDFAIVAATGAFAFGDVFTEKPELEGTTRSLSRLPCHN